MDIKNLKNLYNQIPTEPINRDQRVVTPIVPVNQDLVNKTIEHLNNTPIFTPKVK